MIWYVSLNTTNVTVMPKLRNIRLYSIVNCDQCYIYSQLIHLILWYDCKYQSGTFCLQGVPHNPVVVLLRHDLTNL
jgi:hypothetical protein